MALRWISLSKLSFEYLSLIYVIVLLYLYSVFIIFTEVKLLLMAILSFNISDPLISTLSRCDGFQCNI